MTAIELRWRCFGDGHDDDPITRVLEYRVRDESGVWSAWDEVPEVWPSRHGTNR